MMSKPGGDPSSGISLGDALRLPRRHPACRRREAQPGSCTEGDNLDGDAKGKECPKLEAGCRHRFGSCGWAGFCQLLAIAIARENPRCYKPGANPCGVIMFRWSAALLDDNYGGPIYPVCSTRRGNEAAVRPSARLRLKTARAQLADRQGHAIEFRRMRPNLGHPAPTLSAAQHLG